MSPAKVLMNERVMMAKAVAAARYQDVGEVKATGATYTPPLLADFVAEGMISFADLDPSESAPLHLLDPAIGDGELVLSLLLRLRQVTSRDLVVTAFDTDASALDRAADRISAAFPGVRLDLRRTSFLDYVLDHLDERPTLFGSSVEHKFDLIIANPPYVRTQIIGAAETQKLARAFGLTGRVDLYQAFLIGIAQTLSTSGTAGVIVSNRFMTTKGAGGLRKALRTKWSLQQVWDLGDTKLFEAAVLPAVLIARGKVEERPATVAFSSIYETRAETCVITESPITALKRSGLVGVEDGRVFNVQHGTLATGSDLEETWRIASAHVDGWLDRVAAHTWRTFGDIGKIRVGVKTCADKVFIRQGWESAPENDRPELLRLLTTHHVAGRYRAKQNGKWRHILYPHEVRDGVRRPIDLSPHPKAQAYLESHRETLEGRTYVIDCGRRWYEIWVPQDPAAWDRPKLVFRDISERPTFWLDLAGTIVNGDCYWLITDQPKDDDLLWLAAAVANSTFAEAFYDHRFNNKLYAGRRRFITQYVEKFPLPDPTLDLSMEIAAKAKAVYEAAHTRDVSDDEKVLDRLVWTAFGLGEEASR
jgi:adenine-specific DNA-methyltransferase